VPPFLSRPGMVYPCQELLQFPYQLSGLVLHMLQCRASHSIAQ
jgi:hypothetical protein